MKHQMSPGRLSSRQSPRNTILLGERTPMKKLLLLLSMFLITAPVFAQTRVYTNADLDKPQPRTITPEAALQVWLTHTGGVPPPIPVTQEWDGPAWIGGPSSDWTATLTPTAPLAPDSGACYGCYGGYYGGYSPGYGVSGPAFGAGAMGFGVNSIPGFGSGFGSGVGSPGFGAPGQFGGGRFGQGQRPGTNRGFPLAGTARRPQPDRSMVINPPAGVRLPTTVPPSVVVPREGHDRSSTEERQRHG